VTEWPFAVVSMLDESICISPAFSGELSGCQQLGGSGSDSGVLIEGRAPGAMLRLMMR
jgi:hypothetical protein